jgi:hypothetical protein
VMATEDETPMIENANEKVAKLPNSRKNSCCMLGRTWEDARLDGEKGGVWNGRTTSFKTKEKLPSAPVANKVHAIQERASLMAPLCARHHRLSRRSQLHSGDP